MIKKNRFVLTRIAKQQNLHCPHCRLSARNAFYITQSREEDLSAVVSEFSVFEIPL